MEEKSNKKDIDEMLKGTKYIDIELESEMKKSFIAYAISDKPYRKCALIVGDVLGKYHPHGDSSVYDALVRLAQDFSIRCTLVDGHGNFGSVDGDPPAAYRYTEARLSKIANEMIRDIDKNTVDFYPNFDDTREQPVVLPSRFPNLLVNGSDGIAVGMATSIPPHNLGEVIDGTIALLDNPDIDIEELMDYIPAPDYPTGALIMGSSGIKSFAPRSRSKSTATARAASSSPRSPIRSTKPTSSPQSPNWSSRRRSRASPTSTNSPTAKACASSSRSKRTSIRKSCSICFTSTRNCRCPTR